MIDWNTVEKTVAIVTIALMVIFSAPDSNNILMTGIAAIAGLAGSGALRG